MEDCEEVGVVVDVVGDGDVMVGDFQLRLNLEGFAEGLYSGTSLCDRSADGNTKCGSPDRRLLDFKTGNIKDHCIWPDTIVSRYPRN